MRVRVQNGSEVNLTQSNFLASGGEGQIYVIGDTTYKIYTDPTQMIPLGKIQELSAIHDPHVIKPDRVLLGPRDKPVGFTSKFVHNDGALCQIFTRSFRDRNGVTPTNIGELVGKLQGVVSGVHQANCLIVDLNEMNFLLAPRLQDIYAIDVASYQTPHYKATALMESVRDRHMKPGAFNEGTDWFAFGILSFQMFVGIHPYKGKHPAIKGLDDRMMQNVSVLHKDVGIPQTCYPITAIPKNYLDWFTAVFEKGDRCAPPSGIQMIVVPVKMTKTSGSNSLEILEIGSYDSDVFDVWEKFGNLIVVTDRSIYTNKGISGDGIEGVTHGVGFTRSGKAITAKMIGPDFVLFDQLAKKPVPCSINASEVMSYDGTIFVKNRDKILAIALNEVGENNNILVGSTLVANVLEHATKLYRGAAIQNLLGATYVSLFPTPGAHYQVRVPELDAVRVLDAKFDSGVLMVVGSLKGVYNRYIFRFDDAYSSYDMRVIADITPNGLNFVTLDTGLCVCLNEDETLELFFAAKGSNKSRVVSDPALSGEMRLYKKGGKIVFTKGDKLFSLSLK